MRNRRNLSRESALIVCGVCLWVGFFVFTIGGCVKSEGAVESGASSGGRSILRIVDRLGFEMQASPVDVSLRGVCAVDWNVCWASGAAGTVLRTTDGGANWEVRRVVGAEETDFRDIFAFDANRAVVMGVGSPARFFLTEDGGAKWVETYHDERSEVFFDAMEFWGGGKRGIAFGDPIGGKLLIVRTDDGGRTWLAVSGEGIPDALEGEAGFAGSGSCLAVLEGGYVWIGLGGANGRDEARLFSSRDYGVTWRVSELPIRSSESAGIFSVAFADQDHGVVVGGDYLDPERRAGTAAMTETMGMWWGHSDESVSPSGYRSVVAFVPGTYVCVAAGPNGIDVSENGGLRWQRFSGTGFHSLSFAKNRIVEGSEYRNVGWLVGSKGRIGRIVLR